MFTQIQEEQGELVDLREGLFDIAFRKSGRKGNNPGAAASGMPLVQRGKARAMPSKACCGILAFKMGQGGNYSHLNRQRQ